MIRDDDSVPVRQEARGRQVVSCSLDVSEGNVSLAAPGNIDVLVLLV